MGVEFPLYVDTFTRSTVPYSENKPFSVNVGGGKWVFESYYLHITF